MGNARGAWATEIRSVAHLTKAVPDATMPKGSGTLLCSSQATRHTYLEHLQLWLYNPAL
jgi:hypothetical protein